MCKLCTNLGTSPARQLDQTHCREEEEEGGEEEGMERRAVGLGAALGAALGSVLLCSCQHRAVSDTAQ